MESAYLWSRLKKFRVVWFKSLWVTGGQRPSSGWTSHWHDACSLLHRARACGSALGRGMEEPASCRIPYHKDKEAESKLLFIRATQAFARDPTVEKQQAPEFMMNTSYRKEPDMKRVTCWMLFNFAVDERTEPIIAKDEIVCIWTAHFLLCSSCLWNKEMPIGISTTWIHLFTTYNCFFMFLV